MSLDLTNLATFAQCVLRAQDLREASWKLSDKPVGTHLIQHGEYQLNQMGAASLAASEVLKLPENSTEVEAVSTLIWMLNVVAWNDVQAWGRDVIAAQPLAQSMPPYVEPPEAQPEALPESETLEELETKLVQMGYSLDDLDKSNPHNAWMQDN